jgi:FkbM family methyltransferase
MKNLSPLFTRILEVFKIEGMQGVLHRVLRRMLYNLQKWTFSPYVIRKSICGETVDLLIADLCAESWYDRAHEWPELVWLKKNVLKSDDIVVDCGAHHGLTTILFSRWASAGKVFGYEAHPRNAEIGQKNLAKNEMRNAIIKHSAVGLSVGTAQISDHSNSALLADKDANGITVPMVTLDSEFSSRAYPTFIKIDVEGQELNVLKGATRILKFRPKLDIEIHCSLHADPLNEIRDLFSCISIKDYEAFIQLEVDGPIEKYDPRLHTDVNISQHEVVHLFCLPQ